jgi:hypothetical protein
MMRNNTFISVEGESIWNAEYFKTHDVYVKSVSAFSKILEKDYDGSSKLYTKEFSGYPHYSSNMQTTVDNYTVSYSTNNSNEDGVSASGYKLLPPIQLDNPDYRWSVGAYLNLSSDGNKPQKIEPPTNNAVQSITIGGYSYPGDDKEVAEEVVEEGTEEGTEEGAEEGTEKTDKASIDPTSPLYMVTGITVDKVGGSDVDVSWVDLTNNRHPIDVFVYQMNPEFSTSEDWSYNDDGTIRLSVDGTTVKEVTGISLDKEFNYILPVTLYSNDDTSVHPTVSIVSKKKIGKQEEIVSTDTESKCLCCDGNVLEPGIHFVYLPSDTEILTISVDKPDGYNDNVNVKFGFLFKYKHRNIFDGGGKYPSSKYAINTEDILKSIRELDVPNVFDYTHVPDASVAIEDPLSAAEFFDSRHVFNSVTIPRAELRFSNQLGVDLPFDSSITFVNNR